MTTLLKQLIRSFYKSITPTQMRANLHLLEQLQQENHRLRNEAAGFKMSLAVAQREKDKAVAELEQRLMDAEQRAALLGCRELELAQARKQVRNYEVLYERAAAMGQRIEELEERNAQNARRAATLAKELNATQDILAATEAALEMALGLGTGGCSEEIAGMGSCKHACPAAAQLAGRCVLCIGGHPGLVDGYRRLVETQGGRFLHHDNEQEGLYHIDSLLSTADAVVCQTDSVPHAAYQRLQEACKKLNKPCVLLQSPGVSSFARGLMALAKAAPAA